MRRTLGEFPLLIQLSLAVCVAMLAPAFHGVWLGDWHVARSFGFYALLSSVLAAAIGLATVHNPHSGNAVGQLRTLFAAYLLLPAIMALPVAQVLPAYAMEQIYFEMLSSLTTTGATVFDTPTDIPDPIHLWRAICAWLGGFMILVTAVAILEPMQLGGFEIEAAIAPGGRPQRRSMGGGAAMRERLIRNARIIAPPYLLLTAALVLGLLVAGDRLLVALCHAMSVLSTSGITPLAAFGDAGSGHVGEALIFVFLFAAISRHPIGVVRFGSLRPRRGINPEYKIVLVCVLGLSGLLFARHFLGAVEVQDQENVIGARAAAWGSLFNSLSFLSTTGFSSRDWAAARDWSGLGTPGIIFLALCFLGGGIATTTGGIKLLRAYALYKHGVREMQRLVHPNSVGGAGITARRIRKEGAQIAWVFLMLFLVSLSATIVALTLFGRSFEDALALATAALTNTGPAAELLDGQVRYSALAAGERLVLGAAMLVGRLEVLVLVSVIHLNPLRR
ncbi:MAG: potassium transporter TrkG [Pseudomonadota bacterium]